MKKTRLIENDIETYMLKKAMGLDALFYKFRSPQNSGVPDRILIYKGYIIFIELKAPGKKPRKLQIEQMKEMQAHGAITMIIDSKEAVDELLDKLSKKRKKKTCI